MTASTAASSGQVRRGLRLSFANTVLSRLSTFLLGLVLARLLAPADFGVYAIALLVQNLLLTFNDFGTGVAVVRHRGDVQPMLATAWTISIGGGVLTYLICYLGAPSFAAGLGSPEATGVVRLVSVNVVLAGFAAVPAALLTRELRQGRRLIADLSGTVLNLLLTGLLALADMGPWALAIGHVSGTALVVVLLMALTGQRPRLGIDRQHLREVARFGVAVTASGLLLVLLASVPQIATGSLLGATALGFFYLASNVANWPTQIVATTLERVALAAFSRARDHAADFEESAGAMMALVSTGCLPAAAALALLADPLVEMLYGSRWLPAAAVLSALAVAGVVRVLAGVALDLLLSLGAAVSSVAVHVIWLAGLAPATVLAAHVWGLAGVAWAQAAVAVFVALPANAWAIRRAGVRLAPLLRPSLGPLLGGVATVLVLLVLRTVLGSGLLVIVLGGGVASAITVVVWLRTSRGMTTQMA